MTQERRSVSLPETLAQNAERILSRLVAQLRTQDGTTYGQLLPKVLETRVQQLFDAFWQGVAQNDPKPMTDFIQETSRSRGHEGFAVADLQVIGLCLRKVILEVVDEVYATDPALHLRNSRQIEELILSGLGASVHGFVGGREALISRQFEALRRSQKTEDDNGQT